MVVILRKLLKVLTIEVKNKKPFIFISYEGFSLPGRSWAKSNEALALGPPKILEKIT